MEIGKNKHYQRAACAALFDYNGRFSACSLKKLSESVNIKERIY